MTDALVASHLSKTYDDVDALVDFDLRCAGGELVALVGHNGSGKSTLLRLVAGLLEPTQGTVTIYGAEAGSLPARAELSFIPDEPVLYEDLSVDEHIEYVGRLHGVEEWPDRAEELLERLELVDRAQDLPVRFSRGLRQKTALVLGLVRPFSVLVVDEPFVGLDPAGQRTLTDLLVEIAAGGACVIVATHQLELLDHAHRCLGLRNGGTVFDGPVDQAAIRALLG
jgi:ABC-2 type transport system ATP-binding protein